MEAPEIKKRHKIYRKKASIGGKVAGLISGDGYKKRLKKGSWHQFDDNDDSRFFADFLEILFG